MWPQHGVRAFTSVPLYDQCVAARAPVAIRLLDFCQPELVDRRALAFDKVEEVPCWRRAPDLA